MTHTNQGPIVPSQGRWKSRLSFYWRDGGPVVTTAIIVLCALVWLFELYGYFFNRNLYNSFLNQASFIPFLSSSRPWMFVTNSFLHIINPGHIVFNMLTLWVVGSALERIMGHWRYLALYLLSGIGGGVGLLVYALFDPDGWLTSAVGASGAIFGLFAAILVVYRKTGTDIRSMLIFVGINLLFPFFTSGIAWQAHLGGFITGGVFSLMLVSGLWFLKSKSLNVRMAICSALMLLVMLALCCLCYRYNPAATVLYLH